MKNFLEIPKSSLKKFFCITKYLDSVLVNSISLHLISKLEADKNNDYRGFSRRTFDQSQLSETSSGRSVLNRFFLIRGALTLTVGRSLSSKSKCKLLMVKTRPRGFRFTPSIYVRTNSLSINEISINPKDFGSKVYKVYILRVVPSTTNFLHKMLW